jgi:thioredoxin 1
MIEELTDATFFTRIDTGLVEIGAEWCGPCRQLEPILETLAKKGYPIFRVDVDTSPEIMKKFNIMHVPTLLFFKNGEAVKGMIGVPTAKQLESEFESL